MKRPHGPPRGGRLRFEWSAALALTTAALVASASNLGCASPADDRQAASPPPDNGRALFLKNCAHCHGADARGDEGPDLHGLDESGEWIANRIRNGKKGQMTAFAGKLSAAEIDSVVLYLRGLK
jgi:mono/diheme cytochrome c family protein